jgi:hypothetical protein
LTIKLFPDFERPIRPGDRIVYETTLQAINGKLAWVATQVVFIPAGAKGGRNIIFIDDGEPAFVEENEQ